MYVTLSHFIRHTKEDLMKEGARTGIEWSGPVTFDQQTRDFSILAVGHRSGEISLWRSVLSLFHLPLLIMRGAG